MTTASPTFLGRSDTFFGVCEAIEQDSGINANLLRIALGVGVLFAPVMVLATYALLGLAVVISRVMVPLATPVAAQVIALPAAEHSVAEPAPMKLAA
jgi:phage shock protein C